jgi:hypothetical protein
MLKRGRAFSSSLEDIGTRRKKSVRFAVDVKKGQSDDAEAISPPPQPAPGVELSKTISTQTPIQHQQEAEDEETMWSNRRRSVSTGSMAPDQLLNVIAANHTLNVEDMHPWDISFLFHQLKMKCKRRKPSHSLTVCL